MKNPCPNVFTRTVVEFLTDTSGGFCIADTLRRDADSSSFEPERLKRATFMLLAEEEAAWKLPTLFRRLLSATLLEAGGIDWAYVSTVLTTNQAAN